ncbi:MAG: DUF2058 family protein [bacterium]
MAGSLQDQLINAGLATAEQAKRKKPQRKTDFKAKSKAKPRPKKNSNEEIDLAKAYSIRSKVETREKAEAERKRKADLAAKQEANKALQALVEKHAVDRSKGEQERYFEHRGKIRKLYLTTEQNADLEAGVLILIYVKGRYHLVPKQHKNIIEKYRPAALVLEFDQADES